MTDTKSIENKRSEQMIKTDHLQISPNVVLKNSGKYYAIIKQTYCDRNQKKPIKKNFNYIRFKFSNVDIALFGSSLSVVSKISI